MDEAERERRSMLAILHATCETALEKFGGGSSYEQLVARLKAVLEQTRRELDALHVND
jgi:hypothetical protein